MNRLIGCDNIFTYTGSIIWNEKNIMGSEADLIEIRKNRYQPAKPQYPSHVNHSECHVWPWDQWDGRYTTDKLSLCRA